MNAHSISCDCDTFRRGLDALLEGTLAPGRAEALSAHAAACGRCGREYAQAKALLAALADLPPLTPRPHAIENLQRSIEAEQQAAPAQGPWAGLRAHPLGRFAAAAGLGLLAALVSTFSFSQVALSLKGLSQALLVCALFWVCGYTGIFDLAFRRRTGLLPRRSFDPMRIAERLAPPVLLALGVATLGLLATTPFGGLRLILSSFENPGVGGGIGVPLQPAVPYSVWFGLGALVGGLSLFLGVSFSHAKGRRSFLLDGVLSGSFFALMIAPGFALICVPFTLGLFFVLAGGLVLGALAGGILGFWSTGFFRMRARQRWQT